MNQGERDELIIQLKLIELRDNNTVLSNFPAIKSVKFIKEYLSLPNDTNLSNVISYSDSDLCILASKCGINKAPQTYKADTTINDIPISLKSNNKAPPALVNHTTRPGFELAAKISNGNMYDLDNIIDEYWALRLAGKIREDVNTLDFNSPFKDKKSVLRPFLNYFLFKGTGRGVSKYPAERILGFTNPLDTRTWKLYDETDAVDLYWSKLVFSLRAKKGMPAGYPNVSLKFRDSKDSIVKWTRLIGKEYRGALHIRCRRIL